MSAAAKYMVLLRELAKVPERMSGPAAVKLQQLWRRTYMAGQDPYGNEWAPNAPSTIKKKGHDWVMVDSESTLSRTWVRPMEGGGVVLRSGPNAKWHVEATKNRPARPVMPLHGLPTTWIQALIKIEIEEAEKVMAARRA